MSSYAYIDTLFSMQTESEAAVGFLLDNLGIRDKQQFVRIFIFYFDLPFSFSLNFD